MTEPQAPVVASTELLEACARSLESTLRDEICSSWHYSDYGDYADFDALPTDLKNAVKTAAAAVLRVASNTMRSGAERPAGADGSEVDHAD
jgi:hypothetical protein